MVARSPIPAEIMPLIVFNDCDPAAFQFLEIGEHGTPRHPAERTGQAGRHHTYARRGMTWNNGFLHDASIQQQPPGEQTSAQVNASRGAGFSTRFAGCG